MTLSKQEMANALRFLAIDAVENANSGHPGMPMGMSDIAEVVWNEHLQHNPVNPNWFNRDRFVLSNGHGSMLHYALLYLSGYDLSINDLKNFRQLHSKTPGHPEYGHTPGIETTTGPLGQGLANAVGMAVAENKLAAEFNRDGFNIVDHYTYVFTGDGCLMEGISHEVCSLAGTLGLGKLIVIYDDNGISIDGDVSAWFTDNTVMRFESYNWQVISDVDGHDAAAVSAAISSAKAEATMPTLICCKTNIGFGSPNKVNTAGAHGSPLGVDEVALVRQQLNWPHAPFEIPEDIRDEWNHIAQGSSLEDSWNVLFAEYEKEYPLLAKDYLRRCYGDMPSELASNWLSWVAKLQANPAAVATRKASLTCIDYLTRELPELFGGSSDLTGSNCTKAKRMNVYNVSNPGGSYLNYGVREFGMAAIMNGLAVHGGLLPFGGTFLVFSDYARNAIRLSAMMGVKVIYVLTHDSIGLGEDGPTHQPVEHIASLRIIPGLYVWRPADMLETAVAWRMACKTMAPSCLLLSRQELPVLPVQADVSDIERGAYVVFNAPGECDCILLATGSEVGIAIDSAVQLQKDGVCCRVISVPCLELFKLQSAEVQEQILPKSVKVRIAIEAGVPDNWHMLVGQYGDVIGIEKFGLSAPYGQVYEELGLTCAVVVSRVQTLLMQLKAAMIN